MREWRGAGTSGGGLGLASVHRPAWPRGEPRSAVMLVRLPAILQGHAFPVK
jgi:hypothetical protein